MDDSALSINVKEKSPSRRSSEGNAGSSKEGRKSGSKKCLSNPSKFGWKSIFGIFAKSKNPKSKPSSPRESEPEVSKKDNDNEVYLNDVNDDLAMAISLPEEIKGSDVQVSIELKAIGRQDLSGSETGLKVAEETQSKTTFSGNIKIPSDTTIEQVANMPLYFINPEKSLSAKGELSNKIETVVKPLEDNLPINVDKSIIVSNISLKVNLQKSVDWKCKGEQLDYAFISNGDKSLKSLKSTKSLKSSNTSLRSKTDDIVEEISQTNIYNENSKMIVKDILSQVIEKVETHDMSTQYTSLMDCVNKEIDVQKSLLLSGDESSIDLLSRISEERLLSGESVYPCTTTATKNSTLSITESEGSMYYLKPPTNSPKHNFPPRYMIMYDPKANEKKKAIMGENIKADIDKTLELLETAKNKLLSYLDNAMDLVDFTRDYKYKYPELVSPGRILEELRRKQSLPQKRSSKNLRDLDGRFFLAKNGEQGSSPEESLRIPKLNTIQNIYNRAENARDLRVKIEDIDALKVKFEEVLKFEDVDELKAKFEGVLKLEKELMREAQIVNSLQADDILKRNVLDQIKSKNIADTLMINGIDAVVFKEAGIVKVDDFKIKIEEEEVKSNQMDIDDDLNDPFKTTLNIEANSVELKNIVKETSAAKHTEVLNNISLEDSYLENLGEDITSKNAQALSISEESKLKVNENLNTNDEKFKTGEKLNTGEAIKNTSDEQLNDDLQNKSDEQLNDDLQNKSDEQLNDLQNKSGEQLNDDLQNKSGEQLNDVLQNKSDEQLNDLQNKSGEKLNDNLQNKSDEQLNDLQNESGEKLNDLQNKCGEQLNDDLQNQFDEQLNDDLQNKSGKQLNDLINKSAEKLNDDLQNKSGKKLNDLQNKCGQQLNDDLQNKSDEQLNDLQNKSDEQLNNLQKKCGEQLNDDLQNKSDEQLNDLQNKSDEQLNNLQNKCGEQLNDDLQNKSNEQLNDLQNKSGEQLIDDIQNKSGEHVSIIDDITKKPDSQLNIIEDLTNKCNELLNTIDDLKHKSNGQIDLKNKSDQQLALTDKLINKSDEQSNISDDIKLEIDEKLKARYSPNCEMKNLTFDLVGDDINYMIRELLSETEKIKDVVRENVYEDTKESDPDEDSIFFTMDVNINVKRIINDILERVFARHKLDGDLCKTKKKSICVNYCLMNKDNYTAEGFFNQLEYIEQNLLKMDYKNKPLKESTNIVGNSSKQIHSQIEKRCEELSSNENKTSKSKPVSDRNKENIPHTSVDELHFKNEKKSAEERLPNQVFDLPKPQKALVTYRPQRHGTLPRISVRRLNSSKKHRWLKSEDNLVQHLDRGTNFLKNICSEICSSNYAANEEENLLSMERQTDNETSLNAEDLENQEFSPIIEAECSSSDNKTERIVDTDLLKFPSMDRELQKENLLTERNENIEKNQSIPNIMKENRQVSSNNDEDIKRSLEESNSKYNNLQINKENINNLDKVNLKSNEINREDNFSLQRNESNLSDNNEIAGIKHSLKEMSFPEVPKINFGGQVGVNVSFKTNEDFNQSCSFPKFDKIKYLNEKCKSFGCVLNQPSIVKNLLIEEDFLSKGNSLNLYEEMKIDFPWTTKRIVDKNNAPKSKESGVEKEEVNAVTFKAESRSELIEIFSNILQSENVSRNSSFFDVRSESELTAVTTESKSNQDKEDFFKEIGLADGENQLDVIKKKKLDRGFVKERIEKIAFEEEAPSELRILNKELLEDLEAFRKAIREIDSDDNLSSDFQDDEIALKKIIDHDCEGQDSKIKTFSTEGFKKEVNELIINLSSDSSSSDSNDWKPKFYKENSEVLINERNILTKGQSKHGLIENNDKCDEKNNNNHSVLQNTNNAIFTENNAKEKEIINRTINNTILSLNKEKVKNSKEEGENDDKYKTLEENKTERNNTEEKSQSNNNKVYNKEQSLENDKRRQATILNRDKHIIIIDDNDDEIDNEVEEIKDNTEEDKVNAPQELFLLKKAAKLLKQVENEQTMASQEEIIEVVHDLNPKLSDQQSSFSTLRRQREKRFQYSSSSSEEEMKPSLKKRLLNPSTAISKSASYESGKNRRLNRIKKNDLINHEKTTDGFSIISIRSEGIIKTEDSRKRHLGKSESIISSNLSLTNSVSDYDADHEISVYALPGFRYEYESREDLNDENEVGFIERNAADNLRLNPRLEGGLPEPEMPLICDSIESVATTVSLDSEASLENDNFRYYKKV